MGQRLAKPTSSSELASLTSASEMATLLLAQSWKHSASGSEMATLLATQILQTFASASELEALCSCFRGGNPACDSDSANLTSASEMATLVQRTPFNQPSEKSEKGQSESILCHLV